MVTCLETYGQPVSWQQPRARWRSDERGMTLVEMLVALVVLGVVLSGLAAVIINIARTSVISEREVRATSFAQEALEELHTVDWHLAALYEDYVSEVESEYGAAGEAWRDRLDSDGRFDGKELVLLDAPENEGLRLAGVPKPVSPRMGSDDVEYTIHRYIAETDRSGDGTNDMLKFTVYVTWDGAGSAREVSVSSERGPMAVEAPDEVRVTQFHTSPSGTITLDGWSLPQSLDVTVHTSGGVVSNQLLFPVVVEDPDASEDDEFEDRYMWSIESVTMSPRNGSGADDGVGHTIFDATIPANAHWFGNGTFRMRFEGKTGDLDDVIGTKSLAFVDGDYDVYYPDPTAEDAPFPGPEGWEPGDDDESEEGSEDDGEPGDEDETEPTDVDLSFHSSWPGWGPDSTICVDGDWIADGFVIQARFRGLLEDDGAVSVTYDYRTRDNPGQAHISTATDSLSFVQGDRTDTRWRTEIGASQQRRWQPGETVTFTIDAGRDSDDQTTSREFTATVSNSC